MGGTLSEAVWQEAKINNNAKLMEKERRDMSGA